MNTTHMITFAVTLIITLMVLGSMASKMIVSAERAAAQRAFNMDRISQGN